MASDLGAYQVRPADLPKTRPAMALMISGSSSRGPVPGLATPSLAVLSIDGGPVFAGHLRHRRAVLECQRLQHGGFQDPAQPAQSPDIPGAALPRLPSSAFTTGLLRGRFTTERPDRLSVAAIAVIISVMCRPARSLSRTR